MHRVPAGAVGAVALPLQVGLLAIVLIPAGVSLP